MRSKGSSPTPLLSEAHLNKGDEAQLHSRCFPLLRWEATAWIASASPSWLPGLLPAGTHPAEGAAAQHCPALAAAPHQPSHTPGTSVRPAHGSHCSRGCDPRVPTDPGEGSGLLSAEGALLEGHLPAFSALIAFVHAVVPARPHPGDP